MSSIMGWINFHEVFSFFLTFLCYDQWFLLLFGCIVFFVFYRTVWKSRKPCLEQSSPIHGFNTALLSSFWTRRTCLRRRSCTHIWLITFLNLMVMHTFIYFLLTIVAINQTVHFQKHYCWSLHLTYLSKALKSGKPCNSDLLPYFIEQRC